MDDEVFFEKIDLEFLDGFLRNVPFWVKNESINECL